MATAATYDDRKFLFRLQTLIIDGGTVVVKTIFDQKLPIVPLNVFLSNEKTTINRLRGQKIITQKQYDQLYPAGGQLPSSADFDITLLICLLRNIQSLGLKKNYTWHIPPQPGDTSVEADLCRLRVFRNEVAHISSTVGIQLTTFQAKWIDIEQVLIRLNSGLPNPDPNSQQTFDSFKNSPLDPSAEKRIQAEIDKWREMEKDLETEIQLMKKDVKDISEGVKEVGELKREVKEVTEHVNDIKIDVKDIKIKVTETNENVKHDVQNMAGDITKVKQDVGEVQKDIVDIRMKVTETNENVKHDVQNMTGDITKVKQDVGEVQKDIVDIRMKVTETNENVKHDVQNMTGDITKVKQDVGEVQKDIVDIRMKVTETNENVKHDVQNMAGDITKVKQDVKKNTECFEEVKGDVKKVKELLKEKRETPETNLLDDLQDDLIEFYRRRHTTIPLSPLIEEATPLLEFYVMPDIKAVKVTRNRDGGKEEKILVEPFRNVFYKEDKMCREIYLTADAGLGKTALSKRLALTWCHAKKPLINENRFSQEEIDTMNEFRFVFLLLLRDSSSECDIDDLISIQIISQLARTYNLKDLENVLFKETCLVILDGLDEWIHPPHLCKQGPSSIPHRKARKCLTVLTTTRPWKLSVIGLHSNQIDLKLEIAGLNEQSASMLKKSVISHLFNEKDDSKLEEYTDEFTRAVAEKHISDLEAIPLLLMYLLFLWYYKMDIGQSQSELYSSITELLFSRTALKFKNLLSQSEHAQGDIPCCLSKFEHCRQFYPHLKALGQLAFQTLFRETKEENTLVFDSSVAEQYLHKRLTFCLKTGIITQSKVHGQLLVQKSKISFAHKTVQEFFAAVYMYSTPDQTSVPEIVLSKCKCVKDILEMSKILMFISGINVNVSSLISRELMRIINEDEITRKYRSTSEGMYVKHPLNEFQDMCILCCEEFPHENEVSFSLQNAFMKMLCCKEFTHENEVSFCLQDVFIDKSCKQKQYRENLKHLTTRNKQNIRSLYIDMYNMYDTPYKSAQEVIDYFALHDLRNVEKIHYKGKYNDCDILPLLNKSVKSLSLSCDNSWTPSLFEKVTSLQKLEAISIREFNMSHSELTLLFDNLSHIHCMREIELWFLHCTDHGESCTGSHLDLSQRSQLRKLELHDSRLSEVKINMAALEKCCLYLSNQDPVLHFVNCVPAESKLNTFVCERLESSAAIETMLDTLRLSVHVKDVRLGRINLGDRKLPLSSEMVNIETVVLWKVTMSASVFRGLLDSLHTLPQTVIVDIVVCDITPEREFETEKEKIKTSPHFRVLENEVWFEFETIKDGD